MKLFAMLTGDIQIEKFSQKRITIGVEPYAVEISPVIVEIAAMVFIFSMCTVVMFMLVSLTINRTEYFLHHGDIFEESSLYEASVIYEENLSATYYTPAWVVVKALEIENKREEIKSLKKCKEEEAMKAAQLAANTRCDGRCRNF